MNTSVDLLRACSSWGSRAILTALLLAGCAAPVSKGYEHVLAEKIVGPRLRVAVVEFANKTAYGARLGTAAADILVTELGRTDRFLLIERAKMDKLLAEQKFGMTGAVDSGTAAKMGKLLGAAAIVTGAVSQFGVKTAGSDMLIAQSKRQVAEAVVDVRIIDVETGQILYTESGRGEATTKTSTFLGMGSHSSYDEALEGKALRAAIVSFVGNVTKRLTRMTWSCRIAQVDGRTLYLDAGRRAGLELGAELDVFQLGEEIKSPATGVVIGRKESKIGKARVVRYFSEDGAEAELVEGRTPAAGDLCRIPIGR